MTSRRDVPGLVRSRHEYSWRHALSPWWRRWARYGRRSAPSLALGRLEFLSGVARLGGGWPLPSVATVPADKKGYEFSWGSDRSATGS